MRQVLISRGARSGGALIKGVIPADERTVSDIVAECEGGSRRRRWSRSNPTHDGGAVTDGAPGSVGAPRLLRRLPPIVIGQDLAETIGAEVGDTVLVTSPQGELTPLGLVPRYQRYQVAGIFKSGFYQYDSSYAFIRLADAQRLFSEPDLISVDQLQGGRYVSGGRGGARD